MNVISAEFSFGRTIKTGDFESARSDVKLTATIDPESDEEISMVLEELEMQAKAAVERALGIAPPKPVVREFTITLPVPADGAPVTGSTSLSSTSAQQPAPLPPPVSITSPPSRPPRPERPDELATPAQVRAIYLIGRDQHGFTDQRTEQFALEACGTPLAEFNKKQASHVITLLKSGQP